MRRQWTKQRTQAGPSVHISYLSRLEHITATSHRLAKRESACAETCKSPGATTSPIFFSLFTRTHLSETWPLLTQSLRFMASILTDCARTYAPLITRPPSCCIKPKRFACHNTYPLQTRCPQPNLNENLHSHYLIQMSFSS